MRILGPCVLFLAALALRAIPLPRVHSELGVLPGGLADEFYHLRRIWYSTVRFPEVLSFDPYASFPQGGHVHWPPGFDWGVAALARLLVGAEDQGAVETVAIWVPALLGALAALVTAVVGRAAFGPVAGVVAGAAVAVLPASWEASHVGRVDHHVAVALATVVLLGSGMAWLRADPRRLGAVRSGGLGLAMAVPLLLWPGFLIHLAVAQGGLAVATVGAAERGAALGRARSLALAHGVAAAVLLPFAFADAIPQYGAWSPLVLSRLQPVWLGAAGTGLAVFALVTARTRLGARGARRLGVAGALALFGSAAALLLLPELRAALLDGAGWFAKDEAFQQHVAELRASPLENLYRLEFVGLLLFPLAWLGAAVAAGRARAADQGFLLLWAACFLVLALVQVRFHNSFTPLYALVWGGVAAYGAVVLRRRAGAPGPVASAAAGALALLVLLAPAVGFYGPQLERSLAAREYESLRLVEARRRVHLGAAAWLRRSTPPTEGYLDAGAQPAYGILAPWDVGHLVRYVAERPLVQDNFGVYGGRESFARAWQYFRARDEDEAVALLERLRVRYVVADRTGAGSSRLDAYSRRSMGYRLAQLLGSRGTGDGPGTGDRRAIPALTRHRLVYHARSEPGRRLRTTPPAWHVAVYERVAGARVTGAAAPGAPVEVQLRLLTQAGRRHLARAEQPLVYRARTQADARGRYALTLPYPTEDVFSDAVRAAGSYSVRGGEVRASLAVSERAVRAGERVAGPSLVP